MRTSMLERRLWRGIMLGGMALILPSCGSSDSDDPQEPKVVETPVAADPGIETFPTEGGGHVTVGTVVVYRTDPPTSGAHYPDPAEGGFYETVVEAPYLVHSLEHGAVVVYYNPVTVSSPQKDNLRSLAAAHPGVFGQVICVPRNDAVYPVILTAWTHRLRLGAYDQDGIDGFVTLFLDQGPEQAPETP